MAVETGQTAGKPPTRFEFTVIKILVYSGFLVVVVLLLTLVTQYFAATQESFQDLADEVHDLSTKFDLLIDGKLQLPANTEKNESSANLTDFKSCIYQRGLDKCLQ